MIWSQDPSLLCSDWELVYGRKQNVSISQERWVGGIGTPLLYDYSDLYSLDFLPTVQTPVCKGGISSSSHWVTPGGENWT